MKKILGLILSFFIFSSAYAEIIQEGPATAGGSGTVTTTGSPASGNLTKFSGATAITNGDLSGDCVTSGTLSTTCTKTGGVSFAASATTDATNASNIASGTLAIGRLPTVIPPLQPFGPIYTSDTAGNIFPNFYAGAGGNVSPTDVGLGLKASFTADVTAQMRFLMPPTIPTGTLKLRTICMANLTSTLIKYTVQDGSVSTVPATANTVGGTAPSAVSLSSETQSITTWGSADTDKYKENKVTLTTAPTAGQMLVVAITYDHTNSTNSGTVTCLQPALVWE